MMRYVAPSHLPHADVAHWHPSATPPRLSLFSTLFSSAPTHFWLVVISKTSIGGHLRPQCIFFNYIFVDQLNGQNDGAVTPRTVHPSCMSSPIYNPPQMPTSIWSLYVFRKRQPPKATPPPYLYILMWIKNSSQTRDPAIACTNPVPGACNRPMGRCGVKIWGRHCPTHGERGQICLRVGQQWSVLVVLCCVLWVVGLQA